MKMKNEKLMNNLVDNMRETETFLYIYIKKVSVSVTKSVIKNEGLKRVTRHFVGGGI